MFYGDLSLLSGTGTELLRRGLSGLQLLPRDCESMGPPALAAGGALGARGWPSRHQAL